MVINLELSDRFADFIFDWYYEKYLCIGGYGSGKSYNIVEKLILKCLQEKRKILVVRNVYETIKESCFDLFKEILDTMDLLYPDDVQYRRKDKRVKVVAKKSPMELVFPNGSKIVFRGMDKPEKVKSINGVSIVWLEECSEISYEGYKELLGRIRTPKQSMHFILSCNPVGKENWVYQHFFKYIDDEGDEVIIQDDEELYKKRTIINPNNGVYYHHSVPDDNPYLPKEYIKRLDDIKTYDKILWRIARFGRFGPSGVLVLPQFEIAKNAKKFKKAVQAIPNALRFQGFDFGFETSYNAVIRVAVDSVKKYLYIYDEIYINHITDDKMANQPEMLRIKDELNACKQAKEYFNPIIADNEDPKAISYYRDQGYQIKPCHKFPGSRLSNTRKVKRFRKIICSPKCKNTIRELQGLTYKKDSKGNVIYDDFNIDPHTFSAIWYALDKYNVSDLKIRKNNSVSA